MQTYVYYLWTVAEVDPAATTQTGSIKYNAGALDITLEHVFSKLTVNVRFGTELADVSDVPESGLTLNNLKTKGSIILNDATVSVDDDAIAVITAYKNQTATTGYDETFEAILIPQDATFSVKTALYGGRTFQWENGSNFTFKSGKAYTLNLVVGKDKVELDGSGITVGDWNYGQGGTLETE